MSDEHMRKGDSRTLREHARDRLAQSPALPSEFTGMTPDQIIEELRLRNLELEIRHEAGGGVQNPPAVYGSVSMAASAAQGSTPDDIRSSEQRFRLVFEKSKDAIFVADPETRRLVDCNEQAEKLVGRSKAEILSLRAEELHPPEEVDTVLSFFKRHASGDEYIVESFVLTKDGRRIPVAINPALFEMDGRRLVVGMFRDLTTRMQIETQLRYEQNKFRELFDHMSSGVAVYEARDNGTDFIFIDINKSGELSSKVKREDIVGKSVCTVFPAVQSVGLFAVFQQVWKTGIPQRHPMSLYKDTRVSQWVENYVYKLSSGEIVAVYDDVTERKRAEDAMNLERRQMLSIFDSIEEIIYVSDPVTYEVLYANRWCREYLGKDPTSGLCYREFHNATEPCSFCTNAIISQNKGQSHVWFFHNQMLNRDYQIVDRLIQWPDGRSVRFEFALDITDRKQLEDRLRQTEKMRVIGQLAGGVAHDFNNQLTGILGYAEVLLATLSDQTLKRYVGNIRAAAMHAAQLTKQLLAFSRKGKYVSIPVEVHKVIHEVIGLLEHSIDKRIEIQQCLCNEYNTVLGDPSQLQNAILNLAFNARDAMPQGGTLTFRTAVVDLISDARDPELCPGRYLQICVTDTGTGIDTDVMKHLFEPFFTTKDTGKGTGLGLAAVHGAVRNHHGTIRVERELGKGSTFSIFLPVLEKPTVSRQEEVASHPVVSGACIMVVDDEALVRDFLTDMLEGWGYQVVSCENGETAVTYYRQNWENIHLVILDMIMPRMNGRDTFTVLRTINPQIKAILASGHSLNGEAQKILDEGLRAFIQKPFDGATLSLKISEILRQQDASNQDGQDGL